MGAHTPGMHPNRALSGGCRNGLGARETFTTGWYPPQRENERKDRPPFEEKNQDVQLPSFDFTHRSKEGAKNDAPPNHVPPQILPAANAVSSRVADC